MLINSSERRVHTSEKLTELSEIQLRVGFVSDTSMDTGVGA